VALTGAALLDRELGALLHAFFIAEPSVVKALLDGGMAPLGSFSAKTRIAFALGLISKAEYSDLNLVRAVRNEFAHNPFTTTFDVQTISVRCKMFALDKWASPARRKTPRDSFLRLMSHLGSRLGGRRHNVERCRPRANERSVEELGRKVEEVGKAVIAQIAARGLKSKTPEEMWEMALGPLKEAVLSALAARTGTPASTKPKGEQ
jgi:hypothetical protein